MLIPKPESEGSYFGKNNTQSLKVDALGFCQMVSWKVRRSSCGDEQAIGF